MAVIRPVIYHGSRTVWVNYRPSPIIRAPELSPGHVLHPITTLIPPDIGQSQGQTLTNHRLRLCLWITLSLTTLSLGIFKMNKFSEFLCPDWNDGCFRMTLMGTGGIPLASFFFLYGRVQRPPLFAIPSSLFHEVLSYLPGRHIAFPQHVHFSAQFRLRPSIARHL
jgi:hypothetical protein